MAIYHLSVKTVSRSHGRSATAAAAYRAGVCITDEKTGEIHDYRRRFGVLHSELILPDGVMLSREELWNEAERTEKRKNSCVAREYEISLPAELSEEQRRDLATRFARVIVRRYGVAADLCIHAPSTTGDERNYHAHILTTTRTVTSSGFGKKTRQLDDKKTKEIEYIREQWAYILNGRLMAHGIETVSHLSHKRRGIQRLPTIHLGPRVTAMARRGIQTERGQENEDIRRANEEREKDRLELKRLEEREDRLKEVWARYQEVKEERRQEAVRVAALERAREWARARELERQREREYDRRERERERVMEEEKENQQSRPRHRSMGMER